MLHLATKWIVQSRDLVDRSRSLYFEDHVLFSKVVFARDFAFGVLRKIGFIGRIYIPGHNRRLNSFEFVLYSVTQARRICALRPTAVAIVDKNLSHVIALGWPRSFRVAARRTIIITEHAGEILYLSGYLQKCMPRHEGVHVS